MEDFFKKTKTEIDAYSKAGHNDTNRLLLNIMHQLAIANKISLAQMEIKETTTIKLIPDFDISNGYNPKIMPL